MRAILTLLFIFNLSNLAAQDKIEYERHSKRSEFPVLAIELIETLPKEARRIKFYREQDGGQNSYEVKFKFKSYKYSMEFTTDGVLEDVEVRVKFKSLPKDLTYNITKSLEDNYEKWRIEKVQIQYPLTNTPEETLQHALTLKNTSYRNYELIVTTKSNGIIDVYEFLFDSAGRLLNKRRVMRRSYDFILF